MDVYYPRFGVFVFSLKSRKMITENSDVIYATVVTHGLILSIKKSTLFTKIILYEYSKFILQVQFTINKEKTLLSGLENGHKSCKKKNLSQI